MSWLGLGVLIAQSAGVNTAAFRRLACVEDQECTVMRFGAFLRRILTCMKLKWALIQVYG